MKLMRDQLTKNQFQKLAQHEEKPCISIIAEMKPSWPDSQENRIRAKNLITKARELCQKKGIDRDTTDELLEVFEARLDDDLFWSFQFQALVVYLSPSIKEIFRLRRAVMDRVEVNDHFDMRPLSPLMNIPSYYIFAVNSGQNQLYHCNAWSCEEEKVPNMPSSVDETTKYDDRNLKTNYRTTDRAPNHGGAKGFHSTTFGTGVADSYIDSITERYSQDVAQALRTHLSAKKEKLYLVADERMGHLIRSKLRLSQLQEDRFDFNPERSTGDELQSMVQERIVQKLEEVTLTELENIDAYTSKNLASLDIGEILREARRGRVQKLLIPDGSELMGIYDKDNERVEVNNQLNDDLSQDLLSEAAYETLRTAGQVELVARDKWSLKDSSSVALFRF